MQAVEVESGLTQTQESPLQAVQGVEVHSWDSHHGRVIKVGVALVWVIGSVILATYVAAIFWVIPAVLISGVYRWLSRPYQVELQPGQVTFVGVLATSNLRSDEILRLVRYERPPHHTLDHIKVVRQRGAITLNTGREEIFRSIAESSPSAQIEAEVYDPD